MTHRPTGEPLRAVRPHPADTDPSDDATAPPEPGTVDPAVLAALLHRHGRRRRGGAPGGYGRWTPPGPGTGATSLLVPVGRAFPDSDDLLGEALLALSRSGTPSAREILLSLAVPSDEIRWARDVPAGPGDTASWTAEERPRSAARRMLLAGALATRAQTGYHGARHRRAATAALDDILVGPAPGGRRLTAFVPVTTGRLLAVRLHHALYAAREAVDYRRATGGMEAFDSTVAAGVSHEFTDALLALVRGTEGARVAVGWAPAAGVPEGCGASTEPVEFSPGDLPALREATARYLRAGTLRAGPDHRHRRPAAPLRAARLRHRTAAGAGRGGRPARADHPGRGGVPGRAAGAGAGAPGEPGRVPPPHRRLRDRPGPGRRRGTGPAAESGAGARGGGGLLRGGVRGGRRSPGAGFAGGGAGSVRSPSCVRSGMAPRPTSVRRDRCQTSV